MIYLVVLVAIIFLCFSAVILFGAPYLPTLKSQLKIIFDLAEIKPGQKILELGCGDGRVLIAAAKQGINSVGYELNPILALLAWLRTIRYRKYARVVWANYWSKPWPETDYVFTFLVGRYMAKLDRKIENSHQKPVSLISFAFQIPSKQPDLSQGGIYIYRYQ